MPPYCTDIVHAKPILGPMCFADSLRKNSHICKCRGRLYRPHLAKDHQKQWFFWASLGDPARHAHVLFHINKFNHAQVGVSVTLRYAALASDTESSKYVVVANILTGVFEPSISDLSKKTLPRYYQGNYYQGADDGNQQTTHAKCKLNKLKSWKQTWSMNVLCITMVFHMKKKLIKSK